jgi:hypothetical protein
VAPAAWCAPSPGELLLCLLQKGSPTSGVNGHPGNAGPWSDIMSDWTQPGKRTDPGFLFFLLFMLLIGIEELVLSDG